MTQKFVSAVAMIMSFKILKYFSSGKVSFFLLVSLEISNQKNWSFLSEILTHTTEGLIEKEMLFPGEMLVYDWNLPYLEVNGI